MKLIIPLNGKTEEEIKDTPGTEFHVNWDALIPTLGQFVKLRDDEEIQSLVADETFVIVKVVRRKGRKVTPKKQSQPTLAI